MRAEKNRRQHTHAGGLLSINPLGSLCRAGFSTRAFHDCGGVGSGSEGNEREEVVCVA